MSTSRQHFSLNQGPSGQHFPMTFEDMVWLFTSDNRNRGILRMNFDESAAVWQTVQATTGVILEVGRRHGGSTCLILAASRTRKVISIDIAPEHLPASEVFFARPENRCRLHLIVGDSRIGLAGQSYGFIFFDGDHSYEGLRGDVLAHWNDLVSSNGFPALAAFHDAVPNPGLAHEGRENFCEGVQKVCEALVSSGCAEVLGSAGSVLVLGKLTTVGPEVFSATNKVVTPETPCAPLAEQANGGSMTESIPFAPSAPVVPNALATMPLVGRSGELAALKAMLGTQPQDANLWVKLATNFCQMNQLSECDVALHEALRLDPRNERALLETGKRHLQRKRPWEALACFERVNQINPYRVEAILLTAQYQEDSGDAVAARLDYLRVLKVDPTNVVAKARVAALDAKV